MIHIQRLILISSLITIPPFIFILLYHFHDFLTGMMIFFGVDDRTSPPLAFLSILLPAIFVFFLIVRYLDR